MVYWLRANKISLNTDKTEINLFRTKKIEMKKHMNLRISGQKICRFKARPTSDIQTTHAYDKLKFKRAKCVLPKVRYHFDSKLLKNISCYF